MPISRKESRSIAEAQFGYSSHSTPVPYPAKMASVPRRTATFQKTEALTSRIVRRLLPSGRPLRRAISQIPAARAACEAHP